MTERLLAKVHIELNVDYEYMKNFIADWQDDILPQLQEHAGVEKAWIELPQPVTKIELETR